MKLIKIVQAGQCHSHRGIWQQKLDIKSLKHIVYTDAAFSANFDHTTLLRYLVLLGDALGKRNILYYSSSESRGVAWSVLGSEMYAFPDGFYYAS